MKSALVVDNSDFYISGTAYLSIAASAAVGWSVHEWLALGSFTLAAGMVVITWYYKHKTYVESKRLNNKAIEKIDKELEN